MAAAVAGQREALQSRPPWQRQAEELRDLVEGLANRIVHRAAEAAIAPDALHSHALAVAAGEQEEQIRKFGATRREPGKARCERVSLEMIDGNEGATGGNRQALAEAGANEQTADQPGTCGGGHGGKIIGPQSGVLQRRRRHRRQVGEMGAGGDLGHDAAEWRMVRELAQHALGEDGAVGREDCHGSLVAGCLNRENRPRGCAAPVKADVQRGSLLFIHVRHYQAPMRSSDILSHEPRVKPHLRALPLRVGTRGSPLALAQTRAFQAQLSRFCPVLDSMSVFEEHVITTSGDRIQDKRLAEVGGKGLFSKEIHEALQDRRIDFAVHSLKDLETDLPPGIVLACTLKREDARDVLILGQALEKPDPDAPYSSLPPQAVVGSASVRRQAQLLHARPDIQVRTIRGNVQTRLNRVRAGEFDGSLLALAGLRRLGLAGAAAVIIAPEIMVPAAGQGIVGVTVRADDVELRELLAAIEDPEARAVSMAERGLLAALDGSCRTPIGGYARLIDGELRLTGLVAREDGSFLLKSHIEGSAREAEALGRALGEELRGQSPADIFLD